MATRQNLSATNTPSVLDTNNRAYSDSNPPETLTLSDYPEGSVATPAASRSTLFTEDGTVLKLKDNSGTIVTVGPSAGGGGGASGPELTATTDHFNTNPTNPASGLKLFTRDRARRLPAFVGPLGQDSQLQPALFSNRVARMNVVNNVATPQFDGLAVTNRATAPAAVAIAATNFYTAMARVRYASTATAGNAGGFRSTTAQWFMSSTANLGGFFAVIRLGLNQITATNRIFVGFSTSTSDLAAATNPTSYTNMFGFGCDSTHTTFRFMHNDASGTATSVDLGANFPCQTAATYFYEFRLFAPSAAGQQVYWSAHRLNDSQLVQGGPVNTNLPPINTLLSWHTMHSNGTTAAAAHLDLQSLYIETDN